MSEAERTSTDVAREWREKELTYVIGALATILDLDDDEQRDAICDLREWAKNRLKSQLPAPSPVEVLSADLPGETKSRIPPPNPQLDAHVNAVADFMQELAPYLGLDDGLVSTRDFIDAARRIREWCHDHQTLPKLEYSEHCGCCQRNKVTVEVFATPEKVNRE